MATVAELKELITWLRDQGAHSVRVGDISAVFVPEAPESRLEYEPKKPIDRKSDPLGADYGVTDDVLLRSA